MLQPRNLVALTVLLALCASGCDGRVVFASNVFLAIIPCAMLWFTVNLEKTRKQ